MGAPEQQKPTMDEDEIGPDFPFKPTPKAAPPTLKVDHDCGLKITQVSRTTVTICLSVHILIYSSLLPFTTLPYQPTAPATRLSPTAS